MKESMSVLVMILFLQLAIVYGAVKDEINLIGVCHNGGSALDGVHQKCSCPFGYEGYDCSLKVGPCGGNPCQNKAECVEKDNGTFQCDCSGKFTGMLCEKELEACDSNPCQNGGNCTNWFERAFKCDCQPGFRGFECAEKILPCEFPLCQNNGLCSNANDGSFRCTCSAGFAGTLCGRKAALYSSLILNGKTEYLEQLTSWLDGETDWHLCYRASKHGWKSAEFHSRCDFKGPTVTIVRAGYYIFGGYSDISWGGNTGYRTTTNSFLFSLRNKDKLGPFKAPVYQNSGNAVYTNNGYGATFGGGHDLYIRDDAHTSSGSYSNLGHTYKPPSGYKYNTVQAKNLLAGNYNFIPTDVEVFYLG